MPRVKKEKYGYLLNGEWVHFDKIVWLNTADGEFSIKLPPEIAVATGVNQVTGETLDEVETAFKQTMADFNSCTVEKTKVILYSFDYHSRDLEPVSVTHFNSGVMISMRAAVYEEQKGTAKSGNITYRYEPIESPLQYDPYYTDMRGERAKNRLVWTQQLEDFFVNTQEAMHSIIKRLHDLQEPAALVEFAMNNPLLTAGGGEDAGS